MYIGKQTRAMHVLRRYSDVVQDPSAKMDLTLLIAISKSPVP
jgi:hypothetical protein